MFFLRFWYTSNLYANKAQQTMMVVVYFCLCGWWFLETAYFKKLLKCFVCNLKSIYHEVIKTSFIIALIKSSLKVRSCYLIQWCQEEHYVAEQATLGSTNGTDWCESCGKNLLPRLLPCEFKPVLPVLSCCLHKVQWIYWWGFHLCSSGFQALERNSVA